MDRWYEHSSFVTTAAREEEKKTTKRNRRRKSSKKKLKTQPSFSLAYNSSYSKKKAEAETTRIVVTKPE